MHRPATRARVDQIAELFSNEVPNTVCILSVEFVSCLRCFWQSVLSAFVALVVI